VTSLPRVDTSFTLTRGREGSLRCWRDRPVDLSRQAGLLPSEGWQLSESRQKGDLQSPSPSWEASRGMKTETYDENRYRRSVGERCFVELRRWLEGHLSSRPPDRERPRATRGSTGERSQQEKRRNCRETARGLLGSHTGCKKKGRSSVTTQNDSREGRKGGSHVVKRSSSISSVASSIRYASCVLNGAFFRSSLTPLIAR
jgi:hypothetical protein